VSEAAERRAKMQRNKNICTAAGIASGMAFAISHSMEWGPWTVFFSIALVFAVLAGLFQHFEGKAFIDMRIQEGLSFEAAKLEWRKTLPSN
jgi:Na+/H+ antiporter NhaC